MSGAPRHRGRKWRARFPDSKCSVGAARSQCVPAPRSRRARGSLGWQPSRRPRAFSGPGQAA
eukprot:9555501-Lingulodinium_polyedra.AAC.1